ncbi:MAG: competence protein CoiA [Alcanivorax sp.]|jgi:competence protein CoiA-like protein|nr:competence protein CoiA [Alcanivorax sp.]|tara:strand:- start:4336 stop:5331 length:996 start_codon:yes stop_codon:yes gene_type:complete
MALGFVAPAKLTLSISVQEFLLIDLTLIPFGLRVNDDYLVDVSHVERGRRCRCICPSCKTPLIARQGDKKTWHFAHASRAVYEETHRKCEYSFFVSVRLMARQVIGESIKLEVPKYEDSVSMHLDGMTQPIVEKFLVAKRRTIEIEDVEIERARQGVIVDVVGFVDGYPIILYLTHPGRDIPPELESLEDVACGIIEISLEKAYPLFLEDAEQKSSYLDRLRSFLEKNIESKRWVSHPRYKRARVDAEKRLEGRRQELMLAQRRRQPKEGVNPDGIVVPKDIHETAMKREECTKQYICVMCNTEWVGTESAESACPVCKTHFFRRPVRDDD